jgi:hypothetical protein
MRRSSSLESVFHSQIARPSDRTLGHTARMKSPLLRPTPAEQEDVVRVSTDLVVVNVTVLDKAGKFVSGLKRADFQIFEDGTPQRISTFSAEETPFRRSDSARHLQAAWNRD